jgi:F1F0 ATPase subunit 2
MEYAATWTIPLFAGCLLGIIYFGGLWDTVRRIPGSPRPYRLLLWSYAGRLTVALGGFFLFMDGTWVRLTAAVIGFLAARTVMVRWLGRPISKLPKGVMAWKS